MVIGGIAVIAHGVARQTVDIDAMVLAARLDTSQVLEALADCSIRPRIPNFLEFAEESQVLLLVHEKTQVTLEISFAFTSLEQQASSRCMGNARSTSSTGCYKQGKRIDRRADRARNVSLCLRNVPPPLRTACPHFPGHPLPSSPSTCLFLTPSVTYALISRNVAELRRRSSTCL